ncbi:MAG: flagellar FlbD family protein [Treponema sp.]|nr:flagellar FlbD family protein [Treponema sp.]
MIELTQLSGKIFWINPHQIETAESTPDTTLHMISGNRIVVREDIATLRAKIVEYRRSIAAFGDQA